MLRGRERLKATLDYSVMHDDQHGTADRSARRSHQRPKVTGKDMKQIKVRGQTAWVPAGTAVLQHPVAVCGVTQLIGCDRKGAVSSVRGNIWRCKKEPAACIDFENPFATRHEALVGADVSSAFRWGNLLRWKDLKTMAADPVVFAMANPVPEIAPEVALPTLSGCLWRRLGGVIPQPG